MIGKYRLHNKLGEGGYASVYKCTDDIGIRYACKVLPKDKNRRTNVTQEIAIMKQLQKSPKIVRFVDACEDEQSFYIIQEWCRGGSVQDYMKNYSENTVASIVRGTLRGLCHMHEKNIIHGDIKSSNIFLGDLSEDADVKVGDLGTAIIANTACVEKEADNLKGTPWFMAPENLSGRYHRASDIWSLGVMTYQLLSGHVPFNDRDSPYQPRVALIWRSILENKPPYPPQHWDAISPHARAFCESCLKTDITDRPSALECLEHPWLTNTDCSDRFRGKILNCRPFIYDEHATTISQPFLF